jgi:hypothetical protein
LSHVGVTDVQFVEYCQLIVPELPVKVKLVEEFLQMETFELKVPPIEGTFVTVTFTAGVKTSAQLDFDTFALYQAVVVRLVALNVDKLAPEISEKPD